MNPERKVQLLNTIFQALIFAVIFVLLGQYVGMLETAKRMELPGESYTLGLAHFSFSLVKFWLPLVIGACIGFTLCFWTPLIPASVNFAFRVKARPGSLSFGMVVGFLIALAMVVVFAPTMSILTTVLLVPEGGYKISVGQALINAGKYCWIFFLVAWFFAVVLNKPCDSIARKLLKVPPLDYSKADARVRLESS